jgi:hypothetical protein
MDLEIYKGEHSLSWRGLAEFLGYKSHNRVRGWALGENWPDANDQAVIVCRTEGRVTIEAMHQRRLRWLQENRGVIIPSICGAGVTQAELRLQAAE